MYIITLETFTTLAVSYNTRGSIRKIGPTTAFSVVYFDRQFHKLLGAHLVAQYILRNMFRYRRHGKSSGRHGNPRFVTGEVGDKFVVLIRAGYVAGVPNVILEE